MNRPRHRRVSDISSANVPRARGAGQVPHSTPRSLPQVRQAAFEHVGRLPRRIGGVDSAAATVTAFGNHIIHSCDFCSRPLHQVELLLTIVIGVAAVLAGISFAYEFYMSKVARPPYPSNDMPVENNAPTTSRRGGEEGDHSIELIEEFAKLNGPNQFSYEEVMIMINSSAGSRILGTGGFGIVYEGYIGDARTRVAVKIIDTDLPLGIKLYTAEVKSLIQLRHRNLVQLIGYCHEANKFALVYEFIGGGTLQDHLFNDRPSLTWERRYNIALGLASALRYLHKDCNQCVIHRDIKPNNIMLDGEFVAKLGDFGIARLVDHAGEPYTTEVMGTPGYIAPECYRPPGMASKESDIYSFGVVLLEIVCGRRVSYSEGLVPWVWKHYGSWSWCGRGSWSWSWRGKFLRAVDRRLGNDFDKKQAEALMIVGLWCAHPIAESRPSIEEAMAVLNMTAEPPKLPTKMPSFDIH